MTKTGRTQADRREETQAKLLGAARQLFGYRGYAAASLENIADACDLTIRPIYHYFESKLGLFAAVVEQIEGERVRDIEQRIRLGQADIWSGFMNVCQDSQFRQIMLIDGPAQLGRMRMTQGIISKAAGTRTAELFGGQADSLSMNMLMGALSSAALYIAENGATAEDYQKIRGLINFHSSLSIEDDLR